MEDNTVLVLRTGQTNATIQISPEQIQMDINVQWKTMIKNEPHDKDKVINGPTCTDQENKICIYTHVCPSSAQCSHTWVDNADNHIHIYIYGIDEIMQKKCLYIHMNSNE